MKRYRVMLQGEDGVYCLKDGFQTVDGAEIYLNRESKNYGDAQGLFIEVYWL